jgi:hypothetical protein
MGTQKIFADLRQQRFVQAVSKLGGKHFGPIKTVDVINSVLAYFAYTGLPAGVVYSAPEGLTRELVEMIRLSRDGQYEEARKRFDYTMEYMVLVWERMQEGLEEAIDAPDQRKYHAYVGMMKRRVISEAISTLKMQFDLLRDSSIDPDRAEASVLSMGERSFTMIVIEPMCELVTKFFKVEFVCLNPYLSVVGRQDQEGFTNLIPDVLSSSSRLKEVISSRKKNLGDKPVTFFMPGFYMRARIGSEAIGTMPFNFSDTSADILSRSFGPEPLDVIYVKQVEGEAPTDVKSLIETQNAATGDGIKKPELVATFVLEELLREGRPLKIYDTAQKELLTIPAKVAALAG